MSVFKLSDLSDLYGKRLSEISEETEIPKVHSTRLKERILEAIPGLISENRGRDTYLSYREQISDVMYQTYRTQNEDRDAICLMKAAQIVRKEIFKSSFEFSVEFSDNCEKDNVPSSLLELFMMIMGGTNIKEQIGQAQESKQKIALNLAQLLMFNCTIRSNAQQRVRHDKSRETPLSIFLSLYIHSKTRSKELIDKMHDLGLCISYSRVIDISTCCGQSMIDRFNDENVVCPSKAKSGVTTGGMIDNIDANFKSRLSLDSFHGTAISLVQFPTVDNPGEARRKTCIDTARKPQTHIDQLPAWYAIVPAVALTNKEPKVPPLHLSLKSFGDDELVVLAKGQEHSWLHDVQHLSGNDHLHEDEWVSWAAYHASKLPEQKHPVSSVSLLPLFYENAHSAAMMLHGMHIVRDAIQHLNPGQTPFLAGDQPLYAIMKQCQWTWPDDVGEDKYVVMMGGLHLEMTTMKMLGHWLNGSGWATVLAESGVTTSGRADEALKGSNVARARHMHQITVAVLFILQHNAYIAYQEKEANNGNPNPLEVSEWKKKMCDEQPQFYFWSETMNMELDALVFVRSIREANFLLYCQALANLIPLFFAMDHTNYSRWASVHLRDMKLLPSTHPDLYNEFLKGHFTVQKSKKSGVNIALDHAHEQENAKIKGEGGAVGLFQDEKALRRWMVAGPETARLIEEFEACANPKKLPQDVKHHDQTAALQQNFKTSVNKMVEKMEELGNPFLEDSGNLFAVDTKDVMGDDVIKALKTARHVGKTQFEQFSSEILLSKDNKPITDTVSKNKIQTFSNDTKKVSDKSVVENLKADSKLFSEMYISTQRRQGDMSEFFSHENNEFPPSLSRNGHLREGTKSDLIDCLLKECTISGTQPSVDAKILDGPAVVQLLRPRACRTFGDYATDVFIPYITHQLETCRRLDIVWDVYQPNSLKRGTRQRRGQGIRRKVVPNSPIPANWQGFLRVDENKEELYTFLGEQVLSSVKECGKPVLVTNKQAVLHQTQHSSMT